MRCNFRCSYCYTRSRLGNYFNREVFERTIDIINELPRTEIELLGGEPCLTPNFIDYIKKFKRDKEMFCLYILTNGSYPEIIKEIGELAYPSLTYHTEYHSQKYLNGFIDIIKNVPHTSVYFVVNENNKDTVNEVSGILSQYTSDIEMGKEFHNNHHIKLDNYKTVADDDDFILDGKLLTLEQKRELIIERANFYGGMCQMNSFHISPDGSILLDCSNEYLGNVMDSRAVEYFKPRWMRCDKTFCNNCFIQVPKYIKEEHYAGIEGL